MRFRTLEIRWHDSKPISTCDFQPLPFKRARPPAGTPGNDERYTGHSYRLATGGEDNHVRVWMVHPNIRPTSLVKDDPNPAAPRPPRIEYISTLSRHSAPVNVVRFSPNGEFIASAGDDGMIIIWAQSSNPHQGAYGSDIPPDELLLDKEFWKPRTTFRCTTMQVYDLAWSPTGEYIIAGSTDNTARVFASMDGKCVCEIAEHSHFVQGVAWDPLNEYIATQSSDRSMHVYRISTKNGQFEAHAVGRNTRMPTRHTRTPSAHGHTRPKFFRSESSTSDAESAIVLDKDDTSNNAPLTPATSVTNTPSLTAGMFPPPPITANSSSSGGASGTGLGGGTGGGAGAGGGVSSRRSSFSASSNAPNSPHSSSIRYGGRSPSPMPPLPAIRSLPPSAQVQHWANVKLYGDESFTNFFRRLTFSPDGALLLTPAGQFEDPIIIPSSLSHKANSSASGSSTGKEEGGATTPVRGRKGRPTVVTDTSSATTAGSSTSSTSTSSVYIYSRANFARPPIAQLPGHKKASVAIRFSPILYELRPSVEAGGDQAESSHADRVSTATAALEKGMEGTLDVDVTGPVSVVISPPAAMDTSTPTTTIGQMSLLTPQRTPAQSQSQGSTASIASPVPKLALSTSQLGSGSKDMTLPSPGLSPMDLRPPTPAASKPPTPGVHSQLPVHIQTQTAQPQPHVPTQGSTNSTGALASTASIFALPYRMLYAVVTMDAVAIYDTQQAGPVCLLTKLHYDEFTDMTCFYTHPSPIQCRLPFSRTLYSSWSPDGQTLLLSSRDGYCTIIIFDEILPTSHTQQHALQLQSIAHQNSVPLVSSSSAASTPATSTIGLPPPSGHFSSATATGGAHLHVVTPSSMFTKRRSEPPLTPAASTDGGDAYFLNPFTAAGATVPSAGGVTSTSGPAAGSASDHTKNKNSTSTTSTPKKKESQKRPAPGTESTNLGSGDGDKSTNAGNPSGQLQDQQSLAEKQPEATEEHEPEQPPKKKRRVALTRVGDLDS
ncbi:hypothetical protein D9756_008642 [Leucocoprinus leucothites]|uniref:CAF1B/HIR1 beta-propeller domain-containing protein n=1 Tax=Leucocoprinus leucothites TaxID=201217 RepID=A0A8H5FUP8_9AGAR|nr:hypothetical protein D9756_008642 [Leucoagaricus leucothites]